MPQQLLGACHAGHRQQQQPAGRPARCTHLECSMLVPAPAAWGCLTDPAHFRARVANSQLILSALPLCCPAAARACDGEHGKGFWMFAKEYLNRTTHRNLTMPGHQSVSIVFDTVPAGHTA